MSHLDATDALFFARRDATLDRDGATALAAGALEGMDDGELFLEYRESEAIALEDGRIRSAGFDTTLGFGLRAVSGEAVGYAHAGELSEAALKRAAETVRGARRGRSGTMDVAPRSTNARLYSDANPVAAVDFAAKTRLLAEIDAYARGRDPRVVQVMASLTGEWQAVQIIRADGARAADYFDVMLRYPHHRAVLHASTLVAGNGLRFAVHGTRGSYLKHGLDAQEDQLRAGVVPGAPGWGMDPRAGEVVLERDGHLVAEIARAEAGDYRRYYAGIRDAILHGAKPPVTPQQMLDVMRLIELGLQSSAERREIAVG